MRTISFVAAVTFTLCAITAAQSPSGEPSASTSAATEHPQTYAPAPEYPLVPVSIQNAAYPTEARERRIEGEVVAMFVVTETGDITHVNIGKGDPVLTHAVEDAVAKWKFQPLTKDGKPIPVMGKATFEFSLADDGQVANGVPPQLGNATNVPRKVRVSSGVMGGLLLKRVNPVYPDKARRNGIQGVVLLQATIDQEGVVSDLQLISGAPALAPAAMKAVKQWRYKPFLLMGLPMEVETQVQVNFVLSR
jgi:TonB family protein